LTSMSRAANAGGNPVIEAKNLTKVFNVRKEGRDIFEKLLNREKKTFKAVDDVSFEIYEGERIGLLGPNGAGKTTIIQMLCGLIQPTSGTVLIRGMAADRQQSLIGLMMGRRMIYHRLTGYNNLEYYARLYGVEDIDGRIGKLCNMLRIGGWLDEYVEYYSDGMKYKLAVARALVHDPEILILDEPTLGLDLATSEYLRGIIGRLRKTVLLTTHYVEEAKELSDRVVILSGGRVRRVISNPRRADIRRELLNGRS